MEIKSILVECIIYNNQVYMPSTLNVKLNYDNHTIYKSVTSNAEIIAYRGEILLTSNSSFDIMSKDVKIIVTRPTELEDQLIDSIRNNAYGYINPITDVDFEDNKPTQTLTSIEEDDRNRSLYNNHDPLTDIPPESQIFTDEELKDNGKKIK